MKLERELSQWLSTVSKQLISWECNNYYLCALSTVPSPPTVMINPFNGVALAGASLRVFCSVIVQDGIMYNNTLTVMWTRDDGGILLPVGESFGPLISFSSVRTSHGGQYTCTARLSIPEAGVDVSGANTTNISIQCTYLHHYHSLYDIILSSLILPQLFLHLRLSLDPPGI